MFVKRNKTDNFQLPLHVFCHFLMGKYHTVQGTVYSVQCTGYRVQCTGYILTICSAPFSTEGKRKFGKRTGHALLAQLNQIS